MDTALRNSPIFLQPLPMEPVPKESGGDGPFSETNLRNYHSGKFHGRDGQDLKPQYQAVSSGSLTNIYKLLYHKLVKVPPVRTNSRGC